MSNKHHILVLFEQERGFIGHALRGFFSVAKEQTGWLVDLLPYNGFDPYKEFADRVPDALVFVGSPPSEAFLEAVPETRQYVLAHNARPHGFSVTMDDFAIGALAARFFRERGFTQFAWIGDNQASFAQRRMEGWCEGIRAAGFETSVVSTVGASRRLKALPAADEVKRLLKYCRQVPVAVFTNGDGFGRNFLLWCAAHGYSVPSDVAVLSVNNEPFYCETIEPGLSSIALPWEAGGRLLAEQLREDLTSKRFKDGQTCLPPARIVERGSTRMLAFADPFMRRVYARMQEEATRGATVEQIAGHFRTSRRTLERLFKKYLHMTPKEVMLRVQLSRAQELLRTTQQPIALVAEACGIAPERFATVFKQSMGCTPLQYRRGKASLKDESPTPDSGGPRVMNGHLN